MKFRIYYQDGSTVDGDDEEMVTITLTAPKKWLEAPNDGLQTIVYKNGKGSIQHRNAADYYFPLDGEFNSCNDLGPFLRATLKGFVKCGLTIPYEEYKRIEQLAKDYNWENYQKIVKPYRNGQKTLD